MKIAVLGTGMVGVTIATKLVELGHDVTMGSRNSDNEDAQSWAQSNNSKAGTFDDAAHGREIIFNCVNGVHSLEALSSISPGNIDGKIIIDVANELEVVDGKPRSLASATNSLARKIHETFPNAKIVKSLNTINAQLMVNPSLVPGDHLVFISGEDAKAKLTVHDLLVSFGWKANSIIDLGGIETAVGPEMYMSLWLSMWMSGKVNGQGLYNISIAQP